MVESIYEEIEIAFQTLIRAELTDPLTEADRGYKSDGSTVKDWIVIGEPWGKNNKWPMICIKNIGQGEGRHSGVGQYTGVEPSSTKGTIYTIPYQIKIYAKYPQDVNKWGNQVNTVLMKNILGNTIKNANIKDIVPAGGAGRGFDEDLKLFINEDNYLITYEKTWSV